MKRTDKYRDSYQYDNQNQNHRRQSEDASYRQQYAKGDPEEHPERYYNGRDYRREQILKKKTRNPAVQKVVIYHYCHSLNYCRYFVTRALLNNDSDKVSNDPKVSQNYKNKLKIKTAKLTSKSIMLKKILKQPKTDDIIKIYKIKSTT